MSAIADLIAAARASAVDDTEHRPNAAQLERLADAAEKELAAFRKDAADLERAEGLLLFGAEPRIDLEALRKASEFIASFVRASDAMAHEWKQGDWRAVLKLVRDMTEDARSLLAQLEGAKGQPKRVLTCEDVGCPCVDAPKPEAQTCPGCGGKGVVCSEFTDTDGVPVDEKCDGCNGTGKVGGA